MVGESGIQWPISGMKWNSFSPALGRRTTTTAMLIGEYRHTLDPKKRLSLPAKFRKELGETVVLTRGLDSCLFIFSQPAWTGIMEKMKSLPLSQADTRGFSRFLLSGASEAEVDTAGRILIPEHLKEFAGLKNQVVLAGVSDRIEVWDEKAWNDYRRRIERNADQLAEKLGTLGIL